MKHIRQLYVNINMKIKFKNELFKNRIMSIIFRFVLIPVLLLCIILGFFVIRNNRTKVINRYETLLSGRVKDIGAMYKTMIDRIGYIKSNIRIRRILTLDYGYSFTDEVSDLYEVRDLLEVFNMMEENMSVRLYSVNDNVRRTSFLGSVEEIGDIYSEICILGDNEYIWRNIDGKEIAIYCGMYNSGDLYGIIEEKIKLEAIRNMFDFITGDEASVFYEMDDTVIPITDNSIKHYKRIESEMEYSPHRLILDINSNTYYGNTIMYFGFSIFAFAAIIMLIMHFAGFSVDKATNGLYELIESVDVYKFLSSGEKAEPSENIDEFDMLYRKFYGLLESLKDAQTKIQEHENFERKMKLELLQANINPHFLYNSLSAIRWLSNDKRVNDFVKSLVEFYRIGLNQGESITTVGREMEMVNAYINVERAAFGDDFTYTADISEEASDGRIIKNSIQPIVENAFMHGINGMGDEGCIKVSVTYDGENIKICVCDNGRGMNEECVSAILGGRALSRTSGYGMKNVIARLKNYYGDDYTLEIESGEGKGTTVRMILKRLD